MVWLSIKCLYETLNAIWNDQEKLSAMRRNARREYEAKYTEDVNYRQLVEIYESVLSSLVV